MRRRPGWNRDCRGFSLTEAIVSCLIAAITGSIAISFYSAWIPDYRLKAAARDLYSCMHQAKMTAIKTKADCSIKYYTAPDRYFVSGTSRTVRLGDYGSGVRFGGPPPDHDTFSVATITFNYRGFSNSGYAYLTNELNTGYYKVGPSWSTGVVRMYEYAGDGKWN